MAILEDSKGDNSNAIFGTKGKKGKTWKGGANGQEDSNPPTSFNCMEN